MRLGLPIAAIAVLVAIAMLLTEGLTSSDQEPSRTVVQTPPATKAPSGKPPVQAEGVNTTQPAKPAWRGPRHLTALVPRRTQLRDRPHGRPIAALPARTTWKSPRVLFVAKRRDGWLGVVAPELPNGHIGWIPHSIARIYPVSWELRADLSARRVTLMHAGRVVRRVPVAIGGPGTPTPRGRFAVTDKLEVKAASPYGCCILALSGHQPNIAQGWGGGDRIALHATTNEATVGSAVSHGCLRARARDMKVLIREVPLGTPIYIKA
ncbi:MAG TPA: L,D-transpeptidase [Thermoleophilaceae bacterium]